MNAKAALVHHDQQLPDNVQKISHSVVQDLTLSSEQIQQQKSTKNKLSFEYFVYDYFLFNSCRSRDVNDNLVLTVDGQRINIKMDTEYNGVSRKLYTNAIDYTLEPFETEQQELIIFMKEEPIVISATNWAKYKQKYALSQWISHLRCVNRNIPPNTRTYFEQWLSDKSTFVELSKSLTVILNIDGQRIPLIGTAGRYLIDMYKQQSNRWSDVFNYLIQIGYVSYDCKQKRIDLYQPEISRKDIFKKPHTTPTTNKHDLLLEAIKQLLVNINERGTIAHTNNLLTFTYDDQRLDFNESEIRILYHDSDLNIDQIANYLYENAQITMEDNGSTMIIKNFHNNTYKFKNLTKYLLPPSNKLHMNFHFFDQDQQQPRISDNINQEVDMEIWEEIVSNSSTSDDNDDYDEEFYNQLINETSLQRIARFHQTIQYMYEHGRLKTDKENGQLKIRFANDHLIIPYDSLEFIMDRSKTSLSFTSFQISEWLYKHADQMKNSRTGNIILTFKEKSYELPLIKTHETKYDSGGIQSTTDSGCRDQIYDSSVERLRPSAQQKNQRQSTSSDRSTMNHVLPSRSHVERDIEK
ncbi:unnamed protein product [Didymodactylos carnosus]|uniref:Uncharacterized protein n=1 Tax=Didymodactylos carnosus TaxID=1234261 RepID=A0A8S2N4C8_9BILA|nr:unnamed protein product [Didymodactylos carnosus]CAF3989332.1 unnamed protein product [Didymodactylos carnosus]